MNIHSGLRMGKAEFLAWVQAREGRYELAGSRVVMMTGGSRGHAIIVRQLTRALEKRLDAGRWAVLTSDFGVDVGPSTVRYPDVVVDIAGGALRDLTATAPAIIAEVVSPSSEKDDLAVVGEGRSRRQDRRISPAGEPVRLSRSGPGRAESACVAAWCAGLFAEAEVY